MRVKTRYKNPPTVDTSPAVSQQPSLAEVPSGSVADTAPVDSGHDPSLAIAQQIAEQNRSEQSQHDRVSFEKQMAALNPGQYRTQEAAPPPLAPRQQIPDYFQPPPSRRNDTSHLYSAPVSREVPDGQYFAQRQGRVTLSAAQKEAAKIAGISEIEYASLLPELERRKQEGHYER